MPIGLLSFIFGPTWMSGDIINNLIQVVGVVALLGLEFWFLGWGVWGRKLVADKERRLITITTSCPFIFSPTTIRFEDVLKIRVSSYNNTDGSGFIYNLCFDTAHNGEIIFGHFSGGDREKHEMWRDELAKFIELDNITSVPYSHPQNTYLDER